MIATAYREALLAELQARFQAEYPGLWILRCWWGEMGDRIGASRRCCGLPGPLLEFVEKRPRPGPSGFYCGACHTIREPESLVSNEE